MKKQFLILAGSALIFASCGSNENTENNQQAQIDSIAAANQALQDEINKKKNDSAINAMAEQKAKEMEAANASKTPKKPTNKTTPKEEPTPPPPPPPAPTGMKKHSDQSQSQDNGQGQKASGGGMRSHSDQNQGK